MKLTPKMPYYAVVCSDRKYAPLDKASYLICGVFASRSEAQELKEDIKDCPLPHTVKKVNISVEWPSK